jgi:hypothetical protein
MKYEKMIMPILASATITLTGTACVTAGLEKTMSGNDSYNHSVERNEMQPWQEMAQEAISLYGKNGKISESHACFYLQGKAAEQSPFKSIDEVAVMGESVRVARKCMRERNLVSGDGPVASGKSLDQTATAELIRHYWKASNFME